MISGIIVAIYTFLYYRLGNKKWTLFLFYPIICLIFSIYYVAIKIYILVEADIKITALQIPFVLEPALYASLFVFIYLKQSRKAAQSS